jgi:hypothetical protein
MGHHGRQQRIEMPAESAPLPPLAGFQHRIKARINGGA